MIRRIFALSVVALLLALSGCLSKQEVAGRPADGLNKKLTYYTWIEEGKLLAFIVGTRPTRYREAEQYIPLEIAIANRGLGRLTLTRESFTLIDEDGNRYPCAAPDELLAGYKYLDLDRNDQLAEMSGIVFDRFAAFTRWESNFSPTRTFRRGTVYDRVVLPKYGYLIDFVYFPMPENGIRNKRFDLFLEAPELEDPVFVTFVVQGKKE